MRAAKVVCPVAVLAAAALLSAPNDVSLPSSTGRGTLPREAFIMFSANAPRDAPGVFGRYFTPRDYARIESISSELSVARRRSYALVTTLRKRWLGEPGLRYWVDRGCGRETPGAIVYDPALRYLTPEEEQHDVIGSVRRAARVVGSTGCHAFGVAPGASLLFGMDDQACSYDLDRGLYRVLPWRSIDIIDIQAQRFLGDRCVEHEGVEQYVSVVSSIASFARHRNPDVLVVSQVSFRDNSPSAMHEGIASVSGVIDGIYFSYPSTHPDIPCLYCTPVNLETFLRRLRS